MSVPRPCCPSGRTGGYRRCGPNFTVPRRPILAAGSTTCSTPCTTRRRCWWRSNGSRATTGANTPGVDGLTVAHVEEFVRVPEFLDDLRAAGEGRDVSSSAGGGAQDRQARWVGKARKLGTPMITDRVVQAALKLVLEPIFEADFVPISYGPASGGPTTRSPRSTTTASNKTSRTGPGPSNECGSARCVRRSRRGVRDHNRSPAGKRRRRGRVPRPASRRTAGRCRPGSWSTRHPGRSRRVFPSTPNRPRRWIRADCDRAGARGAGLWAVRRSPVPPAVIGPEPNSHIAEAMLQVTSHAAQRPEG
jgi:hypothetical protein